MKYSGTSYVALSSNKKLGNASATLSSQETCPKTCSFYNSGCYAEGGNMGIHTRRLNKDAESLSADTIIENEAAAIRAGRVIPGFSLRLHVVGDCLTDYHAKLLSSAVDDYKRRGGGEAWTYTHSWKSIKRESWGSIRVLASCETKDQVIEANKLGYRAALVVDSFDKESLKEIHPVPCPNQTHNLSCSDCKICMNDTTKSSVLFSAHGSSKKQVLIALGKKIELKA